MWAAEFKAVRTEIADGFKAARADMDERFKTTGKMIADERNATNEKVDGLKDAMAAGFMAAQGDRNNDYRALLDKFDKMDDDMANGFMALDEKWAAKFAEFDKKWVGEFKASTERTTAEFKALEVKMTREFTAFNEKWAAEFKEYNLSVTEGFTGFAVELGKLQTDNKHLLAWFNRNSPAELPLENGISSPGGGSGAN